MAERETFDAEMVPPEGPGGELARVVSEGDPEIMLRVMETKAKLAGRMKAAIEHLLISQTYPEDWTIQGDGDKAKACLASAGAERIGRNFPIAFSDVKTGRETFEDEHGKGYRYICVGYATLYDRKVYAEGSYSTRDEFLGKAKGEWRPLEEINEGDIRSAAHHIFQGNAVKELLGLRGLPASQYNRIMKGTGQDVTKSSTVRRGQGTQGGTPAEDTPKQMELAKLCIELVNQGYTVAKGDDGHWNPATRAEGDDRDVLVQAKEVCETISGFTGKDGKDVRGKGAKDLKGRWLDTTLGTARSLVKMIAQGGEEYPE